MSYEVGQSLWFVGKHNYIRDAEVTVVKIGRTWVELSNGYRLQVKSVLPATAFSTASYTKNYGPIGTVYATQACHAAYVDLCREWSDLRQMIGRLYAVPEGVTVDRIREAVVLLGVGNEQ